MLTLFGALAMVIALPNIRTHQGPAGFVVLHFGPSATGEAGPACKQEVRNSGSERTLFRGYRTPAGDLLTITGHVALRFKASTSERQIDSLIAATGTEAFSSLKRAGCRRYVFSVAQVGDDPTTIANALQQSGLVEYATPDFSAGRAEGTPGDSFLLDQVALSNFVTGSGGATAVDAAPSTYGMGQVLSEYTGPVMRVSGATISAQMSSATSSSASALALVKAHGLTTLRLQIPERSPVASVRVVLYSLSGTPIRQLVSEALEAGQYIVGWDGMDDRGRRVQPGVYVAVMTAGNFRETHRLVVR